MRHASDRHRAVQVRRVQAERVDQDRPQPGLLEEGPALSRRDRIHDHAEPLDRDPGLRRRQVRPLRPGHPVDPADEGAQGRRRRTRSARLCRGTCRAQLLVNRDKPPFDNPELRRAVALALDRKAFIDIISDGAGQDRRRDDAAAGRQLGHAAGDAADAARLRPGRAEEPRRGPRDHEEARLRPGQAARGQGLDPQHAGLPRPGGAADRPAEGDLYRRRR